MEGGIYIFLKLDLLGCHHTFTSAGTEMMAWTVDTICSIKPDANFEIGINLAGNFSI